MPKEDLDKHLRFIDGELNLCSTQIVDLISSIKSRIQEIENNVDIEYSRCVKWLRHETNRLQKKVFLITEEKRRLMTAKFNRVKNMSMKPKRHENNNKQGFIPGSNPVLYNMTTHLNKSKSSFKF